MLGNEGFEPVRMVAIDEAWSAKRFRRAGIIKNMTRPKEYQLTEPSKTRPAKAPPGRQYYAPLTPLGRANHGGAHPLPMRKPGIYKLKPPTKRRSRNPN
jgi:hypothetical protein